MPENVEDSHTGLPPDFLRNLSIARVMVKLPVHQNLDRWMRVSHSFGTDTGGGD